MKMNIKEEDKDLNYWKENCKEDYLHTPISVLRYITKLEEAVNGVLDGVSCCECSDNFSTPEVELNKCFSCGKKLHCN